MVWHGLLAAGLFQPAKRAFRSMATLRSCGARSGRACIIVCLRKRLSIDSHSRIGLASWPLLVACSMYPGEKFLT